MLCTNALLALSTSIRFMIWATVSGVLTACDCAPAAVLAAAAAAPVLEYGTPDGSTMTLTVTSHRPSVPSEVQFVCENTISAFASPGLAVRIASMIEDLGTGSAGQPERVTRNATLLGRTSACTPPLPSSTTTTRRDASSALTSPPAACTSAARTTLASNAGSTTPAVAVGGGAPGAGEVGGGGEGGGGEGGGGGGGEHGGGGGCGLGGGGAPGGGAGSSECAVEKSKASPPAAAMPACALRIARTTSSALGGKASSVKVTEPSAVIPPVISSVCGVKPGILTTTVLPSSATETCAPAGRLRAPSNHEALACPGSRFANV